MSAAIPEGAMTVVLLEEDLVGVIEMLVFVAELCDSQPEQLNVALCRHTHTYYPAGELAAQMRITADRLARALGFADANLEFKP
jgi:hypothetical protein